MMQSTVRNMFQVKMKDFSESFQFKSEVRKIETETLLSLHNPNYKAVLKQHH